MTPVYQQPFFVDQKDEDHLLKLFGFSSNQASSSLSRAAYLNTGRDQRGCRVEDHQSRHILHDDPKVADSFFFGASTDSIVIPSPSSSLPPEVFEEKATVVSGNEEEDHSSKREFSVSLKWMSSKTRIMHKMVNKETEATLDLRSRQYQKSGMNSSSMNNDNKTNITIRVCSDCKTTTTPLWRSGPQGPKSLCNACGIRQRKARRAVAEAAGATANSTVVSSSSPSLKQNKEKKSRTTSHLGQNKAKFELPDSVNGERKHSFNSIALSFSKTSALERVFPRDEEEGAILLMELSCGFVHG